MSRRLDVGHVDSIVLNVVEGFDEVEALDFVEAVDVVPQAPCYHVNVLDHIWSAIDAHTRVLETSLTMYRAQVATGRGAV